MSDEQKQLTVVLIIAILCLFWGAAKAWPGVPVWLVAALVSVVLATAIVGGVL